MGTERGGRGLVADLRIDLRRFHDHWMGLVYPRQVDAEGSVLGRWRPRSRSGLYKYRLWGAVGVLVVALSYPLVLVGTVVRFHARRIDATGARLGLLGVVVVSLLAWGLLSLLVRARFTQEGFLAVVAAGAVATVSAVLAVLFARIDGRATTVLLAYPFGVTALFLPPVVAALYSPTLAGVVFPRSTTLAIWLLDTVLAPVGLAAPLRERFTLVGVGYVLMWFALAVPVGWTLGALVALADVVRPRRR